MKIVTLTYCKVVIVVRKTGFCGSYNELMYACGVLIKLLPFPSLPCQRWVRGLCLQPLPEHVSSPVYKLYNSWLPLPPSPTLLPPCSVCRSCSSPVSTSWGRTSACAAPTWHWEMRPLPCSTCSRRRWWSLSSGQWVIDPLMILVVYYHYDSLVSDWLPRFSYGTYLCYLHCIWTNVNGVTLEIWKV